MTAGLKVGGIAGRFPRPRTVRPRWRISASEEITVLLPNSCGGDGSRPPSGLSNQATPSGQTPCRQASFTANLSDKLLVLAQSQHVIHPISLAPSEDLFAAEAAASLRDESHPWPARRRADLIQDPPDAVVGLQRQCGQEITEPQGAYPTKFRPCTAPLLPETPPSSLSTASASD